MFYTTNEVKDLFNSFTDEQKAQLEDAEKALIERMRTNGDDVTEKDALTELIDYAENCGIEVTDDHFKTFLEVIENS